MKNSKYEFYGIITISDAVTEIEDGAFAFRKDIHEVRLPPTIKRIGKFAFQECVNLEKINFPYVIEEIGEAAFCNCLSLIKPKLPEGVKFGELAFHHTLEKRPKKQTDCNVLHTGRFKLRNDGRLVRDYDYYHFVIPDGVREIGDNCFENECVVSLQIPEGVVRIVNFALTGYKGHSIQLPSTLEEIGVCSFSDSELREIFIPKSVKRIERWAFDCCANLQSIVLEEGIKEIGADVFSDCNRLKKIIFPQSLKKIGARAFIDCDSLEEVVLPDGIEEIGTMAFNRCPNLKEVKIPSKAKIGEQAFGDYWRQNRKCGYCGSEQDGESCSSLNCLTNKEV